jgi:predicted permease
MRWFTILQSFWQSVFDRQRVEADLDDELQDHLEREIASNMAAGMSPKEARFTAQQMIGSISIYKEECRDQRGIGLIEAIARNLRFAIRMLRRSPLFTAAAVLTLALAIGANSALFSITNQVLLRALPVKDPNRLVVFNWHGDFIGGSSRGLYQSFAYPAYRDLRDGNPGVFTGIAAQYQETADVGTKGTTDRAVAELVSGNYFQVLGVEPAIGRLLTPNDDQVKGAEPYVVLSYEFWRRRFDGNPSILNRVINVNSHPMTVVGVSQQGYAGFYRDSPSDLFLPMMMKTAVTPTWDDLEGRNSIWLHIFGRLAPGVTAKEAAVAMSIPYRHALEQDLSATGRPRDFSLRYLKDTLSFSDGAKGNATFENTFAKPLYVLLAMVGVLLLIACANIANLLIARAAARRREIAIRLSLGATRASLVGMILTESLCIAVCAGVLAAVFSIWLVRALAGFLPFDNMRAGIHTTPDFTVLAFTTAVTLGTALVFGLLPALQGTRPSVGLTLKNESSSISASAGQIRARQALVCVQVALSLVLLFAAGLFARSLHTLLMADTGMNVSHVVQFSIDPSLHKYTPELSRRLFVELQQKLRRIPGIVSVSAASYPILANDNWQNTVHVESYHPQSEDMNPGFDQLLPEFFTTMGAPLIAGRDFAQTDTTGAHQVAIVNETFVKRFVPHGSPLGLHFGYGEGGPMPFEIIGVVRDFKSGGNLRQEPKPFVFLPMLQNEAPGETTYYVRATPRAATQSVRQVLRSLDPTLPLYEFKTLEMQIDQTQFVDRLFAWLSSAFGILATLLAAIGLYGTTSYAVTRRTQEIGIRIALGAEQSNVFRMIMSEVLVLTGLGIVVGAPLVYWAAKIASNQVFGIRTDDPIMIAAAVLVIVTVSALAGFVPARRATRVDPILALRYE